MAAIVELIAGRAQLRQLQAAFQAASEGDGGLVRLAGEPGIGKTALCEQLCRSVEASGGRPLVGHCYEEGWSDLHIRRLWKCLEVNCSSATLSR